MNIKRYISLPVALLAAVILVTTVHAAENFIEEGNKHLATGEYEWAIVAYDKAIELDPASVPAYIGKGIALMGLGRYIEGEESYRSAIGSINGEFLHYRIREGSAPKRPSNYDELIKKYDKGIELSPKDKSAYIGKGLVFLGLGRFDEAIQTCDKVIELDRKDPSAYYCKGRAIIKQRNEVPGTEGLNDVLKVYDKLIEAYPEYALAYFGKAYELYESDRYEDAIVQGDKAIELDPRLARQVVYLLYARPALTYAPYNYALGICDKAIRLYPNDALAYFIKCQLLFHRGHFGEAIKTLDKAMELEPEGAHDYKVASRELYKAARRQESDSLENLGRHDEAIRMYDKLIEIDPEDWQAYRDKGTALYALERYEDAITMYDKCIELEPDDVPVSRLKMYALIRLKKYDDAVEAISRALAKHEKDWGVRNAVALALIKRNKGNDVQRAREMTEYDLYHQVRGLLGPDIEYDWDEACAYANLGRRQEMLDLIEVLLAKGKGAERGEYKSILINRMEFDPYRGDPEFRAIVGQ